MINFFGRSKNAAFMRSKLGARDSVTYKSKVLNPFRKCYSERQDNPYGTQSGDILCNITGSGLTDYVGTTFPTVTPRRLRQGLTFDLQTTTFPSGSFAIFQMPYSVRNSGFNVVGLSLILSNTFNDYLLYPPSVFPFSPVAKPAYDWEIKLGTTIVRDSIVLGNVSKNYIPISIDQLAPFLGHKICFILGTSPEIESAPFTNPGLVGTSVTSSGGLGIQLNVQVPE